MSMYTSTKALFTQCTLKESNVNVNVRCLYSALFHKDSKCLTRVNGGFLYGESGSRYNSYLEITYDSTGAPSTEKSNRPPPFADVVTKAALSPQLCEDPECWSGRRLLICFY